MKLWHDDIRRPPDDTWVWARTNLEAIDVLVRSDVSEASLDHDLGLERENPDSDPTTWTLRGESPAGDGVDLCMAMYHLRLVPPRVTIHSWNPDGAERMASICREAGSEVEVCAFRAPGMDEATYAGLFTPWPA
jgi:hypothetical protein